jgi:acetyltransferase-like isoleucine patch superfamily enzyme
MIEALELDAPPRRFSAHPLALVDTGDIGEQTRIWAFAHVMQGARVGARCNIGEHAFVEAGASLGDGVTVKNGVSIWTGVEIEDNCFLGPHCVFTNDINPRAYIKKGPEALSPTVVRHHASIGANATIVCGNTLGAYSFVGAGSVVIRDVPAHGLVVGNPARQIGWMCACAHKLPAKVALAIGERVDCPKCNASFFRTLEGLTLQNDFLPAEPAAGNRLR